MKNDDYYERNHKRNKISDNNKHDKIKSIPVFTI